MYEYNHGVNARQASININAIYGDGFVSERSAQTWFNKFRNFNFDLGDAPRSGRPVETDEDQLKALLEDDARQTVRELAEQLGCSIATVSRHLEKLGYVQKWGVWLPHDLTQNNKNLRAAICAGLLQRHREARRQHRPFLSLIITGDEKWCLYANFRRRKSWVKKEGGKAQPKVKEELHQLPEIQ